MEQFKGSEDIYSNLVENAPEDEEWLLGLVAFAVVEEQKIEWIKHQTFNNGVAPTDEDTHNWYLQLPSGVLLRAKDTAIARLTDYAQNSIDQYIDDFGKDTEEGIIVGEIREIKKFWPQFGVNLAGGFTSALLFAILLTIFAFLFFNDTSPVEIGEQLKSRVKGY